LVAKELLGPRGDPDEEVTERLLDRYLVGPLAPKNKLIRASEMDSLAEDGEGSVEDGATDDSAPPSDSLYPSSIGLTCTVAGDVHEILVIARWGRYARERSATLTTAQGNPTVVWTDGVRSQSQHRAWRAPDWGRCTEANGTQSDGAYPDWRFTKDRGPLCRLKRRPPDEEAARSFQ
jgi:hypothetical protein